jgi:DNA polymerase-3 subunit gamma/tau
MKTLWVDYVKILETKGRYNLAAILQIDTPKLLDENTIGIEFPNTTNKIELERNQFELLQFLRKSLNNFKITLDISVNETLEKRYAYTSEEKYKKLYEKNNTIELLRKTFDLNL